MKYIRTQGGIHLKNIFNRETDENEWKRLGYKIIAQADTIEELCDEFVFIGKNKLIEHRCWTHLEWAITNCKRNNIDISTIYGAIWTDKGLIYVAKMKGVLPNGEIDWELL